MYSVYNTTIVHYCMYLDALSVNLDRVCSWSSRPVSEVSTGNHSSVSSDVHLIKFDKNLKIDVMIPKTLIYNFLVEETLITA